MSLPDMAEYWQDVKRQRDKRIFVHVKGLKCGHYHVANSDELNDIDCYACLKIIEQDEGLKTTLAANNGKRQRKYAARRKRKKGYKLDSVIKFGKFKGHNRTIQDLIHNEVSYWNWVRGIILLHPEVDNYIEELKNGNKI